MRNRLVLLALLLLLAVPHVRAAPAQVRIAVLGDSRSNGGTVSGTNEGVLARLAAVIHEKKPAAVFFTGDLVVGLEREDDDERAGVIRASGGWGKKGFVYDPKAFSRQLDSVSNLLTVNLGPAMPFHPLIGNHEAVGPDAVERFAKHFKIKNRAPLDRSHLAYTVDVGPVHIVMLATDYYNQGKGGLVEHTLSDQEMAWLSSDLQAHQKSAVRLVMGHEPAYSVFKTGAGLDKHPAVRDRFWATLQANRVDAYICSHEHLYDRRQVGGVWQVISGGGGAPLMKKAGGQAYYHFLLITLGGAQPRVEVIDINGRVRDTFTL